MDLIAGFMDSYLALTAKEELAFQSELDKIEDRKQKASVMELMTSWERKGREEGRREGWQEGRQEGRQEGQVDLVQRLLRRRLGVVTPAALKRLPALSADDLAALAEALLDFRSQSDLESWLARATGEKKRA